MIIIFLIVMFSSVSWSTDREQLLRRQFPGGRVNHSLKKSVPFLDQTPEERANQQLHEENRYSITFELDDNQFHLFSAMTGLSVYKAKYTISWYMFTSQDQIPRSNQEVLGMLNTKKPEFFSIMTYANNNQWLSQVDLPYKDNRYIFAYISYINPEGVLIPLASKSFYYDLVTETMKRHQKVSLNSEFLIYWHEKEYL